jgi:hypothetical protein
MKFLFCCAEYENYSDDDEVEDKSASSLSYVGTAAYDVLRKKHNWFHHQLWNVTSGKVIGEAHQTPRTLWKSERDPPEGHDDWFPQKMSEILSRTEQWADVMSLGPPDGLFLEEIKKALAIISDRALTSLKPVILRMMFGNIVGMPLNCNAIIKDLTADLPENANIQLWVGAWRKGVSWNHAKIIAVDGRYLHTGGHNMWDAHYVRIFHHCHFQPLRFKSQTNIYSHSSKTIPSMTCLSRWRAELPMTVTCLPMTSGSLSNSIRQRVVERLSIVFLTTCGSVCRHVSR